jgi:four helix bundle protein
LVGRRGIYKSEMFNFEKLDVWQEAIEFADLVYELTGAFPHEERFGLTNQMRRAAVSISSNLAEASSRASRIDFTRFVEIATGSLFEICRPIYDCTSAKDDHAKQLRSNLRRS